MIKRMLCAAALGAAMLVPAATAQTPDPRIAHADFSNPAVWLCRPDLKDNKCKVPLDATIIKTNGKTSVEKFKPAKDPKIDCFFVYPTVSDDKTWASDWTVDKMEIDDVALQFARFASTCRQFAPIYRQTTLTALRIASGGPQPDGERLPQGVGGYNDVLDAWNWYMANENKGRGVVLIGHSQGAGVLARLIAQEVEGKPAEKQFISGIILGSSIMVPEGKDVGGTLKTIPLCRKEDQTGCVITYVSFRDRLPPPDTARFGKSANGLVAGCNNPANLATGTGKPDSYFMTKGFLNGSGGTEQPAWATPEPKINTPYVKTPGLVQTTCVRKGDYSYIEVHVNADPKDARTDELAGEIARPTGPDLNWGLHLIDVDHSMGDLVRIVKKQAASWAKKH